MNLGDQLLADQLDRRATVGGANLDAIADAILERLSTTPRESWWQRLVEPRVLVPAAIAVLVVAVVGISAFSPKPAVGPGTSGAAPTSTATPNPYPATQPLTAEQLGEVLGSAPAPGTVVVAHVNLVARLVSCVQQARCANREIALPGGGKAIDVWTTGDGAPEGLLTVALRVRDDGGLDLLGRVREGPSGVAWSLPELLEAIDAIRGSTDAPAIYLVDAERWTLPGPASCADRDAGGYACGPALSWLVRDDTIPVTDTLAAPPESLRLPNPSERVGSQVHGYWLLDPLDNAGGGDCFICPAAGSANLLGRVATASELGLPASATASQAPTPGTSGTP